MEPNGRILTNVRLDGAVHHRLRQVALDRGQSMAEVLREAVDRYLAAAPPAPVPAAAHEARPAYASTLVRVLRDGDRLRCLDRLPPGLQDRFFIQPVTEAQVREEAAAQRALEHWFRAIDASAAGSSQALSAEDAAMYGDGCASE